MPSALTFFKDFVSKNTPVIIEGGMKSWRATRAWDLASLRQEQAKLEVTVNITPDGRGDCVVEQDGALVFVKPEERRMTFDTFVDLISNTSGHCGVPYLSHQNDCLRADFPVLARDVEPCLGFAKEAFGNEPDAVNLWIGDDRAVSSVHKDHYENMYCVVRGEKQFTLLPPSDVMFLYEQLYPQARYQQDAERGAFNVLLEEGSVNWSPVDPACPDLTRHPLFRYASPIQCTVQAGEILYLPSLWYHQVEQKGLTIAVNYWHDMDFDHKFVLYNFLQGLARCPNLLVANESLLGRTGEGDSSDTEEAETASRKDPSR
ncbi:unnamed protein product [Choristocarpus tenellus]